MNLLKIHLHQTQPLSFHISRTTPSHPFLLLPHFLSLPKHAVTVNGLSASPLSLLPPMSLSNSNFNFKHVRVSGTKAPVWGNEEKKEEESSGNASTEFEDLSPGGEVYQKTLMLVERSMFAAVTGLAYFLSNSLAIENYFGCFFALPIVISSMRWGIAAGRKTMVATAMLLLVLSGPLKALTYLVEGKLGSFDLLVLICSSCGCHGITMNLEAMCTNICTSVGLPSPSMNLIYAFFGTLLCLNCALFVFLLHLLYAVFFTRLGMKASLTLPRWLEKAM